MADEKIIIEIEIDNKGAQKAAVDLTAEIARQNEELKEQRKILNASKGDNKEAAENVERLTRDIANNRKELRRNQNAVETQSNSINALRQSVARLTKERNNLNLRTKEGKKRFDELTKSIKTQNDDLKALEKQVGDNRKNVGNYAEDITSALEASNLFNVGITGGISSLKGFLGGIKAAVQGLNVFKVALASTGIGLLLIAISSLVQFFTKTERGAQKLRIIFAGLEAGISKVTDLFISLGESLFDFVEFIVSEPEKAFRQFSESAIDAFTSVLDFFAGQFVNRITAIPKLFGDTFALVKKAIKGENIDEELNNIKDSALQLATGIEDFENKAGDVFNKIGDGAKDAANGVNDFVKSVNDAVDAGVELQKRENALIVSRREFLVQSAELRSVQAELIRQSKDENATSEERRQSLERALEIEDEIFNKRLELKQEEFEIQRLRNAIAESGEEDLQKEAELQAELIALRKERADRAREVENRIRELENRLRSERQQDLKEDTENLKSEFEERNNIIKQQAIETEKTQEELDSILLENRKRYLNDQLTLLESYGEDTAAIQAQITDIELDEYFKRQEAFKKSTDAQIDASKKKFDEEQRLREKAIAEAEREAEANQRIAEQRGIQFGNLIKGSVEAGNAARERAEAEAKASGIAISGAEAEAVARDAATKSLLNSIKAVIRGELAKGIAAQIAANQSLHFPLNVLATAAGVGAVELAFSQIPNFATGGKVGEGNIKPLPNGDNTLAFVKTGEVILNEKQQKAVGFSNLQKANIPNFANGGMVTGSSVNSQVSNTFRETELITEKLVDQEIFLSLTELRDTERRVLIKENRGNL